LLCTSLLGTSSSRCRGLGWKALATQRPHLLFPPPLLSPLLLLLPPPLPSPLLLLLPLPPLPSPLCRLLRLRTHAHPSVSFSPLSPTPLRTVPATGCPHGDQALLSTHHPSSQALPTTARAHPTALQRRSHPSSLDCRQLPLASTPPEPPPNGTPRAPRAPACPTPTLPHAPRLHPSCRFLPVNHAPAPHGGSRGTQAQAQQQAPRRIRLQPETDCPESPPSPRSTPESRTATAPRAAGSWQRLARR
jgi:hypothetical protein